MNTGSCSEVSDRQTDFQPGRSERCGGEKIVHKGDVNALMHSDKMHSCRYPAVSANPYNVAMQPRQKANVEWMRDVMARHHLNAAQWAKKAVEVSQAKGEACTLTGPTITRAMKEEYPFVTKATTLGQLAAAVGEQPPVAADDDQSALIPIPTVEALEAMLGQHYSSAAKGARASIEMLSDLARRMHDSLVSLRDDPAAARVPEAARSAALHIDRAHDR